MPDDQTTGTPAPVTAGAAPWWTSSQFKGLAVTFILAILKLIADLISHWFPAISTWLVSITSAQVLTVVDDVTAAGVAGGLLWALVQRKRSKLQPLTLTKAAAQAAPETQAVVQVQAEMKQAGIDTSVERLAKIQNSPVTSSETL